MQGQSADPLEGPARSLGRERDAVTLSPLFAFPTAAASGSARARSRNGARIAQLRRTNQAVVGLKDLSSGHLSPNCAAVEVWGDTREFLRAPLLGRSFSTRIQSLEAARPPPAQRPTADDAFRRLLGIKASNGLGPGGSRDTAVPLKGEMYKMTPAHVDIPGPGNTPVDIRRCNRMVRRAWDNPHRFMFVPEHAPAAELPEHPAVPSTRRAPQQREVVKAYEDPVLRDPAVRLAFGVRLWQGGMLRTVNNSRGRVSLF
jgi:hypothetical protein